MGILFGILALVFAFVGVFLGGIIGFGLTVLCAVLAIVFAIRKKKDLGRVAVGPIVMSIIAFIFGGIIMAIILGVTNVWKDDLKKYPGEYPVVEAYVDDFKFGVIGMVGAANADGVDMKEFTDELDALTKRTSE